MIMTLCHFARLVFIYKKKNYSPIYVSNFSSNIFKHRLIYACVISECRLLLITVQDFL